MAWETLAGIRMAQNGRDKSENSAATPFTSCLAVKSVFRVLLAENHAFQQSRGDFQFQRFVRTKLYFQKIRDTANPLIEGWEKKLPSQGVFYIVWVGDL